MKKIILSAFFLMSAGLMAHAQDSASRDNNRGYKKDESMETKKTADHSGQETVSKETNPEGKKKSTKQGPRNMQNTMPGTNSTPVPHN